jgi:Ca2+-binding RTX toxin-like protein
VASNILSGGDGRDSLTAGGRRDLLFGGLGADTLRAGSGDDLLVGDATNFDEDFVALLAMQSEWARTDDAVTPFQDRIEHLMGTLPDGKNGAYLLGSSTIRDDWAVDQLYGRAGRDWFLCRSSGWMRDRVRDAKRGDVVTQLLY